jgi:hypothetical protein
MALEARATWFCYIAEQGETFLKPMGRTANMPQAGGNSLGQT